MGWNCSDRWHERRHHGNFWVLPVVILALIILTHGWILFLPLMALAFFAFVGFVGFVLPRIVWAMHNGDWGEGGWNRNDWAAWANEKRKRHFGDWDDRGYDEKPKRRDDDHIDYV